MPGRKYGLVLFFPNTLKSQCPDLAHALGNFFYLFLMDQFLNGVAVPALEIMFQPSIDRTQLTWGKRGKTRKEIHTIHRASLCIQCQF